MFPKLKFREEEQYRRIISSRLTILEVLEDGASAKFRCDCGNEFTIESSQVILGKVKSCGCLTKLFKDLRSKL